MALGLTVSCILAFVGYLLILGMGIAGLVVYNTWNNKELAKERERERKRQYRDSLLCALNDEKLWRDSKEMVEESSLSAGTHDIEAGSQYSRSTLSLDDSMSTCIDESTLSLLDSFLSAVDIDSDENLHHNLTAPVHESNHGSHASKASNATEPPEPRSKLDVSALSDIDNDSASGWSVSEACLDHKTRRQGPSVQQVKNKQNGAQGTRKMDEEKRHLPTEFTPQCTTTAHKGNIREAFQSASIIYPGDSEDDTNHLYVDAVV